MQLKKHTWRKRRSPSHNVTTGTPARHTHLDWMNDECILRMLQTTLRRLQTSRELFPFPYSIPIFTARLATRILKPVSPCLFSWAPHNMITRSTHAAHTSSHTPNHRINRTRKHTRRWAKTSGDGPPELIVTADTSTFLVEITNDFTQTKHKVGVRTMHPLISIHNPSWPPSLTLNDQRPMKVLLRPWNRLRWSLKWKMSSKSNGPSIWFEKRETPWDKRAGLQQRLTICSIYGPVIAYNGCKIVVLMCRTKEDKIWTW